MLDEMPELLYVAFAFAAAFLCYRWWYAGQILDKPCWALYLMHLPFASLVWAMQMWDTARWVSALGNLFLLCCAFEAARACGWWIIPPKERQWVLIAAGGVGLWMAAIIASVVQLPMDQPWPYYLIRACAPACTIGILVSAWGYQTITVNRRVNNSRNAWHVLLLIGYCLLGVLNAMDYSAPSELAWAVKTYATVTMKVGLFICWWFKVCPIPHRHALRA